jgi:uncharacterized protein with PIN domain
MAGLIDQPILPQGSRKAAAAGGGCYGRAADRQEHPGRDELLGQLRQLPGRGVTEIVRDATHCKGLLEAMERLLQVFQRFGKGQGHTAQLNFGDCFAAALAEQEQLPLACSDEDFRAAGF